MSLTKSNGLLTAAVLIALGASTNLFAEEFSANEGIARVSDNKVRSATGRPGSPTIQQASSGQISGNLQPVPDSSSPMNSAGSFGNCENGNCQFGGNYGQGGCPYCRGQGGCPHCGGRGCRFGEFQCKRSPDYGYSPPAKYPLQRRGVEYTSYYPAKWYGAGGDYIQSQAPMVYQPTDTTQLGFYYQHVPFWQPQPSNLPARPIPAQWHINAPAVEASNFCKGGNCRNGGCPNQYYGQRQTVFGLLRGDRYNQNYYESGWYPSDSSTPSQSVQPSVLPGGTNPGEVIAPVPPNTAPRPIETNPSAMLPRGAGSVAQKSEAYLPPLPSLSENVTPAYQLTPLTNNTSTVGKASYTVR